MLNGEYIVNDVCYNAGLVNDIVYTVILTCVCQWIHFIFLCIKVCVILPVFFFFVSSHEISRSIFLIAIFLALFQKYSYEEKYFSRFHVPCRGRLISFFVGYLFSVLDLPFPNVNAYFVFPFSSLNEPIAS